MKETKEFKIVKKEGTNCFLIKVWVQDEYFTDVNWLYLKLTPKDVVYLKSLDSILKQTKEQVKNLYQFVLLNSCKIEWLYEDDYTDEMRDAFELLDDEVLEIEPIEEFEGEDSENFFDYTELAMIHVDEYGVYWRAYRKDSYVKFESQTLPITELK